MLIEVCGPKACCNSKLHLWYCGECVRSSVELMPGGKNFGSTALICARVFPLVKPSTNAALESAASLKRLVVSFGARLSPLMVYEFRSGGLLEKKIARAPGTGSKNIPAPPRSTVLRERPKG